MCIVPAEAHSSKPSERWRIAMSIDEAISKIIPGNASERFHNRLRKVKEDVRKMYGPGLK